MLTHWELAAAYFLAAAFFYAIDRILWLRRNHP